MKHFDSCDTRSCVTVDTTTEKMPDEIGSILVNQLLQQTNLKFLSDVALVLQAYESANAPWLKEGLKNILLHGGFPIKDIGVGTSSNPTIVPQHPYVWPTTVPPVKCEPYCNYNDYKSTDLTKNK